MKTLFIILFIVLLLNNCTNEPSARRVLDLNGYTEIRFTGYNWFGCGEGDLYHTGFTAKTPAGKVISGTVCEGLFFKNSTIRFE